jgi:transposase
LVAIYTRASNRLRYWIAILVVVEKTLKHEGEAVREFYASIPPPVVVGIEATGSRGWFRRLMEDLAIECRVGHPVAIRKADVRRQKHDRRDAALLLQLAEDRFPTIWMPSTELRDLRALLLHRHQWVRMRTRVQNPPNSTGRSPTKSSKPERSSLRLSLR